MTDSPSLFRYARTSPVIEDNYGALRRGKENGVFRQPCPLPAENPAVLAALESHGRVPVDGLKNGMAGSQALLSAVSVSLIILGTFLCVFTTRFGGCVAGGVIASIGIVILIVDVWSIRRRQRDVATLSEAWHNGWLRFAPAQVGGVWVSSSTRHGNQRELRDADFRYRYRALVEVHPMDGSEPFYVRTDEFDVDADREGLPYGLKMADGPLDMFEPEFSNGWTVARWVAGIPESATITTDLNVEQIKAVLRAAGIR
ncbi:hypothetical protein [Corynebacterium anserum]|uniref:Uncharacterized protein n=1 Tax=Corynebacterium anserum TaxID=2684406 RepID=A0A7G7YNE1_9CORY|nr:hypothetical protein [Corynebacterium anserum]MBC2681572.1 hypothetical protein [Corynebacterium anserum]QNH96011.1 hypothetical protein GP473_04415 [Corynebacterium anserum]